MARQKYGGRKKGTPNRRTALVQERLEACGLDPIEEMAKLYYEARETDLRLAASILKELAQYCYPKRKAIEVALETDQEPIQVVSLIAPKPD